MNFINKDLLNEFLQEEFPDSTYNINNLEVSLWVTLWQKSRLNPVEFSVDDFYINDREETHVTRKWQEFLTKKFGKKYVEAFIAHEQEYHEKRLNEIFSLYNLIDTDEVNPT